MSLARTSYEEKRNFIRMAVNTPVSITGNLDYLSGTCLNLSGGGLLIALPKALKLGDRIEVNVCSNHGHSPMLRAQTRVRRIEKHESRDHLHGLEIESILE